ncbi:MAG TPA: PIG-L family deacetylase [Gemmatimonadaceae bacterium]|nr:PIG-L family deacetylase [Gemmatimonadaceae bacterium]
MRIDLRRTAPALSFFVVMAASLARSATGQTPTRTLVALFAHPDDEAAVAPMLARYAREGVQIYEIYVTSGEGGAGPGVMFQRPETTKAGEDLARVRADEARCSAAALGVNPPIFFGFPDGKLGDYLGDRTLNFRLVDRVAQEIARLKPDVVVTWGPDGGYGHPDHRMVSNIATQLSRAGAPGMPERLFYMYLTEEMIRMANPQRGAPPMTIPQAKYFTVRVPITPPDLDAGGKAMSCHRSQLPADVIARMLPAQARIYNGVVALVPAFATTGGADLFP